MAPTKPPKPEWLRPWHGIVGFIVGAPGVLAVTMIPVLILFAIEYARIGPEALKLFKDMPHSWFIASVIGTAMGLFIFSLLPALFARRDLRSSLGLRELPLVPLLITPLGVLGLGPLSEWLVRTLKELAPDFTFGALGQIDTLVRDTPIYIIVPVVAVLPGLFEELFFRGMFQRAFKRGALAVILGGLAFACFHMDPHHVIGVLPVGLYLSWVAARTNSTGVTMLAHAFNNAVAIIAVKLGASSEDSGTPLWAIPVGLIFTAGIIAAIHFAMKARERKRAATEPPAPVATT